MSFSDERNEFIKSTVYKDRRYFKQMDQPVVDGNVDKSELRSNYKKLHKHGDPTSKANLGKCTKVWDIPMIGSNIKVKDRTEYNCDAVSLHVEDESKLSLEERMNIMADMEELTSAFDRDGNYKTNDLDKMDHINTSRFGNQKANTRHNYLPYEKGKKDS